MNNKTIVFLLMLLVCIGLHGQEMLKGDVIQIENGMAYLDITAPKVKIGDVLSIQKEEGYMVHPITKKKIKKEGEILADLEIMELHNEYSVATIYPESAVKLIKIGMTAEMPELQDMQVEAPKPTDSQSKQIGIAPETQQQPLVLEADFIVERYRKLTGIDNDKLSTGTLIVKHRNTFVDKKGKTISTRHLIVRDLSNKRIFVGQIGQGKKYTIVSACTANEGWFNAAGINGKYKQKDINSIWSQLNTNMDNPELNVFDSTKWNWTLGEQRTIHDKYCTGIEFTPKQSGKSVTIYFNDETGLIERVIDSSATTDILDYKAFNGILMPAKKRITLKNVSKNTPATQTVEITDYQVGILVGGSYFTKSYVNDFTKGKVY